MKNLKTLIIIGCLICMPSFSQGQNLDYNSVFTTIELRWKYVDPSVTNSPIHRFPPLLPVAILDSTNNVIYFNDVCYECTLELVIPGTETVVYSYTIPDGDDTVQLPDYLSGEYELHIHRGNFCFWGTIEL